MQLQSAPSAQANGAVVRVEQALSRSGGLTECIEFQPHLSINDYSELALLLVAGAGIGELPPIVQPELLRDGRLVEVLPRWHLQRVNLSIVISEAITSVVPFVSSKNWR
jgi:DNA-binding transcriptional LysR family regulator